MARAVATLAGGALVLTALAGCARPHVFGLRHDRAFTYGSLDSGSIAVVGVTSIAGDAAPSPSTRGQFESLLTTSLREVYPRLEVASPGAVATGIGDSLHGRLLERYRAAGELDSAALHEMRARLAKPRYLVLARIEADLIDSTETVTQDTSDKKSKVEHVELSRSRTMTVAFHVYDMSLMRAVWSGQLTQSEASSNSYDEPRGIVASLVTAIVRGPKKYPAPPTQTKVLRPLFDGFAESLPQPPKRRR